MSYEGPGCIDVAPVVSVVVPTRNRLPLLKEAVESIERQTMTEWEAILVDDCSTDETWSWLCGLTDPRVRISRLPKQSERSAARNRGLEEARGKFVLFLDDDDRLMPRALQYLVRWHLRQPDVVAVVGRRREFDDRGHRRRTSHPLVPIKRATWRETMFGWVPGTGQGLILTAAIRNTGGWNSRFRVAEDHDLWLRLAKTGQSMLVPGVVLECRAHSAQWRPEDMSQLEEQIREKALMDTTGHERAVGESILAARRLSKMASMEHSRNSCVRATSCYMKAIRTLPGIVTSPITGPALAGNLAKAVVGAVVGRNGTKVVKRFKAMARNLLQRNPGASRQVMGVETSGDLNSRISKEASGGSSGAKANQ